MPDTPHPSDKRYTQDTRDARDTPGGDSPFLVLASDLLNAPGARRRIKMEGELEGNLDIDLPQVESCGPVTADLELEAASGGVVARGRARSLVTVLCNRCLGPVSRPVEAEITQLFAVARAEPGQPVGYDSVKSDGWIDFGPLLRDEISLSVPLVSLCREECRGMCATCGADLNAGECGGHDEKPASPFAELQNLLDRM